MRKIIWGIAFLMMAISTMATANMRIVDTPAGSWVSIEENGEPVSNASVQVSNVPSIANTTFKTNEYGEVYIPISLRFSRSVTFTAITPSGNEFKALRARDANDE
ncbi:carboxypeptidase-like regulatory domain-containing protein [Photobacterium makurazakiensis]|uniref:hypothetical protein n=1 Tax=Photobacterium makurazakiensis TaxID=2910234 RepID=UPI003D0D8CC9